MSQAKKILVVDDDESILDAVSLVLETHGYCVETVLKGAEIHETVKTFEPDLILLDVLISGTDGREICRELKENKKTMHIPIIMVSAHPSAEVNIKEFKADGFLAKPFEIKDLLEIIEGQL